MKEHNYFKEADWNKTTCTYTFETNSKIEFFSADQGDKLRGARRDRLFLNECNNITFEAFEELEVRTKEFVYMDFNPTNSFWVFENILGKRDDVDHLILTYKDNESLDPAIVKSIEQRQNRPGWWKVYGLGQLGEVDGKIYSNWQIIDSIPHEARLVRRGLDFGYTHDPSAIVNIYYYNGGYILDEITFQKGLSNKQLADIILGDDPKVLTIGDSAEPKSIDEIRSYGVNIQGAKKGSDSVRHGIQLIQDAQISMTKRSVNVIKEYRNYLWATDRDGHQIDEPEHTYSHCFTYDTRVKTVVGDIQIGQLSKGEWVLTREGFRQILNKFDNGIKPVRKFRLHLDTEVVELECTEDHKILTNSGWIQVSQLKSGMMVYQTKCSEEESINCIREASISKPDLVKECTAPSGSIIMDKFLRGFMSIIRMITSGITGLRIWSFCRNIPIYQNMARRDFKTRFGQLSSGLKGWRPQKNGIVVRRVKLGTPSMVSGHGLIEVVKHLYAKYAQGNILQDTEVSQSTVIKTVKLRHLEKGEVMLKRVYDIQVDGVHEYFANSLLVHNSMDALRYGLVSLLTAKQPNEKEINAAIQAFYNQGTLTDRAEQTL